MTKEEMAKEIKKYLSIDSKSLYDKPVTTKFNSDEYQMLKEVSEMFNIPKSRLIRQIVYFTLIQMKELDKIN